MPMVPRYDVSEGADGLIRVGAGSHTCMKLTREDAAWLVNVLAERLNMPPVKVTRVAWWRRAIEWFGRKARVRRQLEADAMYDRLGKRLAERYGMRE
jgi:hypothetical protein